MHRSAIVPVLLLLSLFATPGEAQQGGSAMPPPVVRHNAIPRFGKRGQLVDPHRGASCARVHEHDRDTCAARVLVPDSRAPQIRVHRVVFCGKWRLKLNAW